MRKPSAVSTAGAVAVLAALLAALAAFVSAPAGATLVTTTWTLTAPCGTVGTTTVPDDVYAMVITAGAPSGAATRAARTLPRAIASSSTSSPIAAARRALS